MAQDLGNINVAIFVSIPKRVSEVLWLTTIVR